VVDGNRGGAGARRGVDRPVVKAAVVRAFGDAGVLQVVERDPPAPGAGELLVRIEACGLNWSDLLQRAGLYPGGPTPPFVAGQEAAGIVVGHGAGVSAPPLGTAVSVIAASGLCAEYAAVPATACLALPGPAEHRAALPIALVTAYTALAVGGRVRPGDLAVLHAAGGGLGTIALQIARRLELRVIATCSPAKRDRARALGAERVCGYDDFVAAARAAGGADLVLDSIGGAVFRRSCDVVRSQGRIVIVGCTSGEPQRVDAVKLVHRSIAVIGWHLRAVLGDPALLRQAIATCTPWLADGSIQPCIARALPLAEIRAAHELLASRDAFGKVVVVP
jgi:NADPH:quinone reductase